MTESQKLQLLVLLFGPWISSTLNAQVEAFSDPSRWGEPFTIDAQATPACATGTVGNLRNRLTLGGPYTLREYEETVSEYYSTAEEPDELKARFNQVSDAVKQLMADSDEIYRFHLGSISAGADGYLVARNSCIVHVEITVIYN